MSAFRFGSFINLFLFGLFFCCCCFLRDRVNVIEFDTFRLLLDRLSIIITFQAYGTTNGHVAALVQTNTHAHNVVHELSYSNCRSTIIILFIIHSVINMCSRAKVWTRRTYAWRTRSNEMEKSHQVATTTDYSQAIWVEYVVLFPPRISIQFGVDFELDNSAKTYVWMLLVEEQWQCALKTYLQENVAFEETCSNGAAR